MLALGVSLVLLLELSIQVARVHDKREARRRLEQGWDGLDPDQPSPLDDRLGSSTAGARAGPAHRAAAAAGARSGQRRLDRPVGRHLIRRTPARM